MQKFSDAVEIFSTKTDESAIVFNAYSIQRESSGKNISGLTTFGKGGEPNYVFLTEQGQKDLLTIIDEAAHHAGYRSNRPHERFYNYLVNTPEGKHKFIKYIEKHEPIPEMRLQYYDRAKNMYKLAVKEGK